MKCRAYTQCFACRSWFHGKDADCKGQWWLNQSDTWSHWQTEHSNNLSSGKALRTNVEGLLQKPDGRFKLPISSWNLPLVNIGGDEFHCCVKHIGKFNFWSIICLQRPSHQTGNAGLEAQNFKFNHSFNGSSLRQHNCSKCRYRTRNHRTEWKKTWKAHKHTSR